MTTTHDDNATVWRDLADQLTPDEVTWFEHFESNALGESTDVAEHLLEEARVRAAKNLRDNAQFGHVPTPAGARKVRHWENDGEGNWSREFNGTERGIGLDQTGYFANRVDVDIDGVQYPDGSIVRTITVYSQGTMITADEARVLAAALIEAADELERLQ